MSELEEDVEGRVEVCRGRTRALGHGVTTVFSVLVRSYVKGVGTVSGFPTNG